MPLRRNPFRPRETRALRQAPRKTRRKTRVGLCGFGVHGDIDALMVLVPKPCVGSLKDFGLQKETAFWKNDCVVFTFPSRSLD